MAAVLFTPNLAMMFLRWVVTVWALKNNLLATTPLVCPSAIKERLGFPGAQVNGVACQGKVVEIAHVMDSFRIRSRIWPQKKAPPWEVSRMASSTSQGRNPS